MNCVPTNYQFSTSSSTSYMMATLKPTYPLIIAHRVCIPSPQAGLALPIIITSTIGGFFCLCTSYSPREDKRTVKRKLNNTDRIELSLLVRVIVYSTGY